MIKNVLIIGLCSILALETLLPDVNLADLSHLPQLLSHFKKHRSESPNLTLAEFLDLHNDDSDHWASSPKDHQGLPFSKRLGYRGCLQIAHETVLVNPQKSYIVLMKIEGMADRMLHTNSVTADVWQPPRT
jgi:hypothetical protein